MLKKLLITVSVFAVLLLLALTYITARFADKEEILRAKNEAKTLRDQRDSIYTAVAVKDSLVKKYEANVSALILERSQLRAEIDSLGRAMDVQRLSVRRIRTTDGLAAKLADTFPQVAPTLRITEAYNEAEDIMLEYVSFPVWFSETIIIQAEDAQIYRAQLRRYGAADSLSEQVTVLQAKVIDLEKEKAEAFQTGYDTAYGKYEDVNAKYIGLLEKPPKVTLGFPKWGWMLGSAAVGLGVGYAVAK